MLRRHGGLHCPVTWSHFQPDSSSKRLYRHPGVLAGEPFPTLSVVWPSADSRSRCNGAASVLRSRPKVSAAT